MHEPQPHPQLNSQHQQQQYFNGKHIQLVKIRLRQTYDHNETSNSASNTNPSQIPTQSTNKNSMNNNKTDFSNFNTTNNSNQYLNNEIFYI